MRLLILDISDGIYSRVWTTNFWVPFSCQFIDLSDFFPELCKEELSDEIFFFVFHFFFLDISVPSHRILHLLDYCIFFKLLLELVKSFNELGIIFNCKLDFRNHIISKATFIKRWDKESSHPYVTKQSLNMGTSICCILWQNWISSNTVLIILCSSFRD